MKKSIIVVSTAIVVLLFSGIAICSALIPSDESLSSNESLPSNIISTSSPITALYDPGPPPPPDGELIPPGPYPTFSPEPYPTWTPTPTPISTSAPLEGQPSTPRKASTGETAIGESVSKLPTPSASGMTLITGEASLTEEEVAKIGGAPQKISVISGSQLWVLYNGAWTMNSAAIYNWDWTYIRLYNDQGQGISTEETYPNGWVDKRYCGYLNPGYKYFTFQGDAVGWHRIVAKGSVTGQTNVIWIYVWPTTPTWPPWPTPAPTWTPCPTPAPTPFTVSAAWPSSYSYYIADPTRIFFTVNKPCWARVTYIKQDSNIVWSGPTR